MPQLTPDAPEHVFVAERDGRTIGFVVAGHSRDGDVNAAIGEVYAICQEADAEHTGVGRALMQQAREDLIARGYATATHWVLEHNQRARCFYERSRWQLDGTSRTSVRANHTRTEVRYRTAL